MARKKADAQEAQEKTLTRAQKTGATKVIVTELLAMKPMRHNELIDEVAKEYALRYEGTDTENPNDVKGRVGSVLDIMKKDGDIAYDGGKYALKARLPLPAEKKIADAAETPAPKKRTRAKKTVAAETPAPTEEKTETVAEEKPVEEKPAPKKRGRPKKVVEKAEEKTSPAPVEEKPVEVQAETPVTEAPSAAAPEGTPIPAPVEEKKEEKTSLAAEGKTEVAPKSVLMDMSFLFGDTATNKAQPKAEKPVEKPEKKEEKPAPVKAVEKKALTPKKAAAPQAPQQKVELKPVQRAPMRAAKPVKPLTEDEKLRESFLKRMRVLSGEYFEYYSVYLLQRYSMKNGRRLESMKISGGDHDGGIDGEIELTDKLGFRETIYIQSKNWDPEKGREDNWVVGETLLQQFIGACACRQARDGKQHARGIFITTSRFTPDAKRILEDMSEKIVGYDGGDLYEAAKECQFGVVKKNGRWELDENLLSGTKAFFQMY